TIGNVSGYNNPASVLNNYTYIDPDPLNGLTWYRIKTVKTQQNKYKYSKVIQLINNKAGLQIESLVNPFNLRISFNLISGYDGLIRVEILDQYQRKLKTESRNIIKGKNDFTITDTGNLPDGVYILRVISGSTVISKKIIKQK
ncbi:MAG: T9SS type A sorting domain-containing protein, partial [Chitinophagaceae bacterium]